MMESNKQVLEPANATIAEGDYEAFLCFCTADAVWNFVGEQVLNGKDAVRKYMAEVYTAPPKFRVENLIAERDFVIALGKISLKNREGVSSDYSYSDVCACVMASSAN